MAALAATLGCSGANAASPDPIQTLPPVLAICKGGVEGGGGAYVPIKVGITAGAGALLIVPDHAGPLSVEPRIIGLDRAHPSAKMTIEQPNYRGAFAILFNGGPSACNSFSIKFRKGLNGPRATATFSIAPAK
jgi:hypothetical protein